MKAIRPKTEFLQISIFLDSCHDALCVVLWQTENVYFESSANVRTTWFRNLCD